MTNRVISIIQSDLAEKWQEILSDLLTDPKELLQILPLNADSCPYSLAALEQFPLKAPSGSAVLLAAQATGRNQAFDNSSNSYPPANCDSTANHARLLQCLYKSRRQVVRVVHCNPRQEPDSAVSNSLNTLTEHDVKLPDQSMVLKDVNDNDLVRELHASGLRVIAPMLEELSVLLLPWRAKIDFVQGNCLHARADSMDFEFPGSQTLKFSQA